MLRLNTLVTRTPTSRHERKRRSPVIAKINKSTLAMDEGGLFLLMHGKSVDLQHMRDHTGNVHLVLAKMYYESDTVKKVSNPKTFVFCDCRDFTFRCEVALAIRGSSVVVNSNGHLPNQTNPNAVPMLCSHALAFLSKCVEEMKKPRPVDESKQPKHVSSDRALIESLKRPTGQHPNLKRMFQAHFGAPGMGGRKY